MSSISSIPLHRSKHAIQHLLDLVFPPQCMGCQRTGSILCTTCLASMSPSPLVPPLQNIRAINNIYHVNRYQGTLRTCIHALKYNGNTRLAEPLGLLLAQVYLAYHVRGDVLLPVPLHPKRQKQRGYNHAELLARVCSRYTGIPVATQVLLRTRATPAQVGLTAQQRQHNMVHAFSVPATQAMHGRRIVIVDDVCTTGATLEACAVSLLAAGVASVDALVLARPM